MQPLSWKFVRNAGPEDMDSLEQALGWKFPEDFHKLVLEYNAGRPNKRKIDTVINIGREFLSLLSVCENDKANILEVSRHTEFLQKSLVPIACDSGGNYYCYDRSSPAMAIVLWEHETASVEYVSGSVTELLNKLYE